MVVLTIAIKTMILRKSMNLAAYFTILPYSEVDSHSPGLGPGLGLRLGCWPALGLRLEPELKPVGKLFRKGNHVNSFSNNVKIVQYEATRKFLRYNMTLCNQASF